ncbi:DNA polymerase III subunit chi [Neptunicella sp. SCSIO 80796]|uniref:DNA polymerase III subunit chi n=1 Tax=Neptunicella plasticusilytica TaxID=3117012 RepID=UPI003A4D2A5E
MANILFYLLEQEQTDDQPAHFALACQLATDCFRQRQRCVVLAENQAQAEAFDELLWQRPTDAFVPHNLSGEGPNGGAPVEIVWQLDNTGNRAVLINLSSQMPAQAERFRQIYDFVPAEDNLKQQARERYKHYRAAGHQLSTAPAAQKDETHNG